MIFYIQREKSNKMAGRVHRYIMKLYPHRQVISLKYLGGKNILREKNLWLSHKSHFHTCYITLNVG